MACLKALWKWSTETVLLALLMPIGSALHARYCPCHIHFGDDDD